MNEATAVVHFAVSAAFHMATSAAAAAWLVAQDAVHLVDAVFGDTDTSRSIAYIVRLIQRELDSGAGVAGLATAVGFFSVLQYRNARRDAERAQTTVLWDVVVLDSGETIAQQLPNALLHHDPDEDAVLRGLPADAEFRVRVDEATVRVVTVEVSGDKSPAFALPSGAQVLEEGIMEAADGARSYRVRFRTDDRRVRERTGVVVADAGSQRTPARIAYDSEQNGDATTAEGDNGDSTPEQTNGRINDTDKLPYKSSPKKARMDFSAYNSGSPRRPSLRRRSSAGQVSEGLTPRPKRSPSICSGMNFAAGVAATEQFPPGHASYTMAKYARFSSASYGDSFMRVLGIDLNVGPRPAAGGASHRAEHIAFARHAGLQPEDILLSSFTQTPEIATGAVPLAHFVAVDHEARAVVLTIRGTLGIDDLLTDLKCDYAPLTWQGREWTAHGGMLRCAQHLAKQDNRVLATLREALEAHAGYGLILCGHSLGGGVAAMLGIMLSERDSLCGNFVTTSETPLVPPGRRIHCFSYGSPAAISAGLRAETCDLVTSVVYGRDIVPSLSLGTLRDFQAVAAALRGQSEDDSLSMSTVARHIVGQLARKKPPLAVHSHETDDYLYSVLQSLRGVMTSEKLLPPGKVYHVTSTSIFETHQGRIRKATRVLCRVVVDVETRFSEPVFGRGVFHHSPVYYERALNILQHGVPNTEH